MTTIESRALTAAIWLELHWRRFLTWRQRRRAKVDRLLELPPIGRSTWNNLDFVDYTPETSDAGLPMREPTRSLWHNPPPEPWPTRWPAFYTDPVKAAGDRAYARVKAEQEAWWHPGPRHSVSNALLAETDAFAQIVATYWVGGEYRCSFCADGDHQHCPSCSCPCSLQEAMA
jgi:hypothetical protein